MQRLWTPSCALIQKNLFYFDKEIEAYQKKKKNIGKTSEISGFYDMAPVQS